jgi:hypothetical protein
MERTAAPLRSSRVAGFGGALWLSRLTGVITAGRLSLSSVVGPHYAYEKYRTDDPHTTGRTVWLQ